jgi:hypothetical protein
VKKKMAAAGKFNKNQVKGEGKEFREKIKIKAHHGISVYTTIAIATCEKIAPASQPAALCPMDFHAPCQGVRAWVKKRRRRAFTSDGESLPRSGRAVY